MKTKVNAISKVYLNVMEELVKEEIEKQVKILPHSLTQYVNPIEVATYALNRLPPLYASCERGKHQQKLFGKKQYKEHIKIAVRQGIAAVQRDPLRSSIPLFSEIALKYQNAESALQDLQAFLESQNLINYQKLSWSNLVDIVQKAVDKMSWTNTPREPSLPVIQNEEEDSWFKRRPYYNNYKNQNSPSEKLEKI